MKKYLELFSILDRLFSRKMADRDMGRKWNVENRKWRRKMAGAIFLVPLAGIEPARTASEADALSTELQGQSCRETEEKQLTR